jgi:hypothetical protein
VALKLALCLKDQAPTALTITRNWHGKSRDALCAKGNDLHRPIGDLPM